MMGFPVCLGTLWTTLRSSDSVVVILFFADLAGLVQSIPVGIFFHGLLCHRHQSFESSPLSLVQSIIWTLPLVLPLYSNE